VIDRSNDIRPPADRSQTEPCECGKLMIGTYDDSRMHEKPPVLQWHWWCGCGRTKPGGAWHPLTRDEALMDRWSRANEASS
jgi:hypothetical protein